MSRHDAELFRGQVGHAAQNENGRAQAAVGDRRGVGDQAEDSRQKRVEAQPDHDGAADGHRGAAAGSAFQKGPERKADQDRLNARVPRQARD